MAKPETSKLDAVARRVIQTDKTGEELLAAVEVSAGEVHLQQYPIFALSTSKRTDTRYTYEECLIGKDGSKAIRRWTVEVSSHYGWPGQHEAEVWRAIEHIVELRARRGILENPFWTSFAEIRRHMPCKSKGGGDQWMRILRSIKVLKNTGIEADFLYLKKDQTRYSKGFDIIDDYSLGIKRDADGQPIIRKDGQPVMDRVQITINQYIWSNIEHRYVRPIDIGYRASLKRWSSRRLYEILAARFFANRRRGGVVRLRYSQICGLLGCKRQRYLSDSKYILGRYHDDLIATNPPFLASVEWHSIVGEPNDWMLTYTPGKKTRMEWSTAHWKLPKYEPELLFVEESDIELSEEATWIDNAESVRVKVSTSQNKSKTYQSDIRKIFVELTGTRQRFDREDRALLEQFFSKGITADDVRAGIVQCQADRQERSYKSRTLPDGTYTHIKIAPDPEPIKTLRYCEGHIWNVHEARENGEPKAPLLSNAEQQTVYHNATYEQVLANQSQVLRNRQIEILEVLRPSVPSQCYDKIYSQLLLVECTDKRRVFFAIDPDVRKYTKTFGKYLLGEKDGINIIIL